MPDYLTTRYWNGKSDCRRLQIHPMNKLSDDDEQIILYVECYENYENPEKNPLYGYYIVEMLLSVGKCLDRDFIFKAYTGSSKMSDNQLGEMINKMISDTISNHLEDAVAQYKKNHADWFW